VQLGYFILRGRNEKHMQEKLHILLAEDDETFGNILRDYLSINGYEVALCRDGQQALDQFRENDYDLIITDVMMPVKDGFSFVNDLRKVNKIVPVIYLTARNQKEDIIRGYKSGADDYITKPFDSEVLLHKISAVLQRSTQQRSKEQPGFAFGKFSFQPGDRTLQGPSGTSRLSPRESELLALLLQHRGEVIDRRNILNSIWGDDSYFNNRSLDVYVTKLRKRLQEDASVQIESLYGSGVKLTA
jgi:DNA-binding response OmpR family regulator